MQEKPDPAEVRLAERMLGWIEANARTLPPQSAALRHSLEAFASFLSARYGLPPINGGSRLGTLADAEAELTARRAEARVEPMVALTVEQWEIIAAGVPISLDEIRECSERCAELWLAQADGDATIKETAAKIHSGGILMGALVQSWRR